MNAVVSPKFSGIYKLEGHHVSKPTAKDEVQGLLRNYLRHKGFIDKLGTAEEFYYNSETYYAADDIKGKHFTQLRTLHDKNPLAETPIGCWGKPDDALLKNQAKQIQNVQDGIKALVENNPVGTLRVEYDYTPVRGNPFDGMAIHAIDVLA